MFEEILFLSPQVLNIALINHLKGGDFMERETSRATINPDLGRVLDSRTDSTHPLVVGRRRNADIVSDPICRSIEEMTMITGIQTNISLVNDRRTTAYVATDPIWRSFEEMAMITEPGERKP